MIEIGFIPGIGPRAEIEKHGIKTILDSPHVGRNLQDHLFSFLFVSCRPEYPISYPSDLGLFQILQLVKVRLPDSFLPWLYVH
jgi:choline dehydrogenase-like flavoprotein